MKVNNNQEKVKKKKIVALGIVSGGLDSLLATLLIIKQGIDVKWVHFISPFFDNSEICKKFAKRFGIELKVIPLGKKYIKMVINPKYGYGKAMNPCIDCHIMMFKEAKKYAKKIKADFIFTGEVLDERPFSQSRKALKIIEKEAGLEGKIVRPLSAKLLPISEAELKGLIDREKLLGIRGRKRNMQIKLVEEFGIKDYPHPAGGCVLTEKEFSAKLEDLLRFKGKNVNEDDIKLLKIGRHFRFEKWKIIVGRNKEENEILKRIKGIKLYVPNYGSPITLLESRASKEAIIKAAEITARYSDAKNEKNVLVKYKIGKIEKEIIVEPMKQDEIERLRIKW
ncbi:MAG: tRNA 4-thiouridine(8) synthase ThiI [Candidatus Aenigmatarchaeota archaeon]